MWKIKLVFLLSCLLCYNIAISQNFTTVPDSLQRYNYLELNDKIVQNSERSPIKYKNNYIYANTCLIKAKKENNIEEIIYGYTLMADVVNDFKSSLKYSDTVFRVSSTKMPSKLSYVYYHRGLLFYNVKRLKESLNCFLMARKYAIVSSIDLNNRVNHYIGIIKKMQGSYEEALIILKECEETARKNQFDYYLSYLFSLAELYNRMDKIDLSEGCTNKGLILSKKDRNSMYFYPYFISNRGKNYYKRKQYDKAIADLSSSLRSIKNYNDYANYAENSYYMGECYREQHQENKAIVYYKKVDSVFTVKNDIYLLTIIAYEHLIDYYKKNEDFKQAVHYSDQFIKADKVVNDNYKYITSKIAKTYDIQEVVAGKQAVIASLHKDKNMSFVTIILLLFGIVMLIYALYYNNKRKKKELEKQKILFEAYRAEKEQKTITDPDLTIENVTKAVKKSAIASIDKKIVTHLTSCINRYEKEKMYLDKEDYTVEMLASKFQTNSSYLSIVINEIKGCTYTHYVNTLRIAYIIEKLDTNKKYLDYTIQGLSELSGYNSSQTFVRAFAIYTKMKPSDYLKDLRNKHL
jgi:AraC-like DNA-binding protein